MTETIAAPGTSRRRNWAAALTTIAILIVVVAAGLLSSADGGAPVIFAERISSQLTRLASGTTGGLWAYSFLLGAVAAFNPCGFGLVPAYVGLHLNETQGNRAARTRRALAVAVAVAGAFAIVFGVASALFSIGYSFISSMVVGLMPWVGLGVGVLLVVAGGVILSGRSLRFDTAQRVASKLGPEASRSDIRGHLAFGIGYGLASLGCTLPLFLALVGTAMAAGGLWNAIGAFALYGLGMATTLGVLALMVSILGWGIVSRVRAAARVLPGLSAALLLASGAYVIYYWLTAGRLLFT